MRTGIIEAITPAGKSVVLANSGVAMNVQKAMFKTARAQNARIDDVQYAKIIHFVSNAKARTLHYRAPQKPAKPVVAGFVASLKELAAALEVSEKDLKAKRDASPETFPAKEADGYNVEACKGWLADA